MPSFRNPMTFAAAAALAATGSSIDTLNGVAVKVVSGLEAVLRASTYADEVANTNHEGF